MRLSVLICSLNKRAGQLAQLLDILSRQATDEVEILVELDSGEMTTGAKRNKLLGRAQGDYTVFIDDDDMVAEDYISEILKALESSPDAVGFQGWMTTNGTRKEYWKISKDFGYETHQGLHLRFNNHLSPVRRDLALRVGFKDISFQEDYDYAVRLKPYIQTEVYIPKELYFYHYKTVK